LFGFLQLSSLECFCGIEQCHINVLISSLKSHQIVNKKMVVWPRSKIIFLKKGQIVKSYGLWWWCSKVALSFWTSIAIPSPFTWEFFIAYCTSIKPYHHRYTSIEASGHYDSQGCLSSIGLFIFVYIVDLQYAFYVFQNPKCLYLGVALILRACSKGAPHYVLWLHDLLFKATNTKEDVGPRLINIHLHN